MNAEQPASENPPEPEGAALPGVWRGRVERVGWGGVGIGRMDDGRIILLRAPLALLPGDEVEARIEQKPRHCEGAVTEYSSDPARPQEAQLQCPAAGVCGGCDLWGASPGSPERAAAVIGDLPLSTLDLKYAMCLDLFARMLPGENAVQRFNLHAEAKDFQRTRIQLHWDGTQLGFHERLSNRIVGVGACPLASPRISMAIAPFLTALQSGELPAAPERWELAGECGGERVVALCHNPELAETERKAREVVRTDQFAVQAADLQAEQESSDSDRHLARIASAQRAAGIEAWQFDGGGWKRTEEPLLHRLTTGQRSLELVQPFGAFFQPCATAAALLFSKVLRGWPFTGATLYDLYSGVGFFSRLLALRFARCELVENSALALSAAPLNLAGLEYSLHCYSVETWLKDGLGSPDDCIIADPPRAGLSPPVAARLNRARAGMLVLVGCDGANFCRDLKRLAAAWNIEDIQGLDLFPNTVHVEFIALLTRRGGMQLVERQARFDAKFGEVRGDERRERRIPARELSAPSGRAD